MGKTPRNTRSTPRRISYSDFRGAIDSDACCAGDGTDATTTLGALAARCLDGIHPGQSLNELLGQADSAPVHGVWHHVLVGEILLVCLQNAGYKISEDVSEEVIERGPVIPGGCCGFVGSCGALASAASAFAILLGSTPVATDPRQQLLEFSAKLANRLAQVGGSRCCKKSSYVALEMAREQFAEVGFELPQEEFAGRCAFYRQNATCDGVKCVYFPRKSR